MPPRQDPEKKSHDMQSHLELQPSQDKERHKEGDQHHPMDHPYPHPPPHHQKDILNVHPDHDAHTNIPHDELPPHHNPRHQLRYPRRQHIWG
jgi:hypothetical protein